MKTKLTKLTVITEANGKVTATQVGHGHVKDPASGIVGGIVAGPGQKLHKIEFHVPELNSADDIDAFHQKLMEHLSKGGGH